MKKGYRLETKRTRNAFKLALVVSVLLSVAFTSIIFKLNSGFLVGLPIFLAMILSMIGVVYLIAAFKEPWNAEKWVAIIVHFGVLFITALLILANVGDIIRTFSDLN